MADEKVNVSPEEKKAPEAPAPSGPGDPPAPEHTEGPAVPGGDQTAPAHVEPAMPEKTEGPIKPEQSVIPGMGEDAPAPSGKVRSRAYTPCATPVPSIPLLYGTKPSPGKDSPSPPS